jgi:hypothetical protein
MILHRERQIGSMNRPALFLQLRKCMMGVQFMQHMPVDVEQIAAVGALADPMKVPNFVEQSARHGVSLALKASIWRPKTCAILGALPTQGKP